MAGTARTRFAIWLAVGACSLAIVAGEARAQAEPSFDHGAAATRALRSYIRPGYQRLADATRRLAVALERGCSSSRRPAIDSAFDGVVDAWGRIEPLTFGPIATDNRCERFFFWPDRRGLAARQVAAAITSLDAGVKDPASLAAKSVGLQGLGALDIVLFGKSDGPQPPEAIAFRCSFAAAIAGNLSNIAREVAQEWSKPDGYAASWLAPGPSNPDYAAAAETTFALAKALDHGLERVRDERLAGPLGLNRQKGPAPALLASSGRGVRLAAANVAGLAELFASLGLEQIRVELPLLPKVTVASRARLVASTFGQVQRQLERASRSKAAIDAPSKRTAIMAVGAPLNAIRVETADLLHSVAGVPQGFSATDGD